MEKDGVCAVSPPFGMGRFRGRGGGEAVKVVLSKTQERGRVNLRPSIFSLCVKGVLVDSPCYSLHSRYDDVRATRGEKAVYAVMENLV